MTKAFKHIASAYKHLSHHHRCVCYIWITSLCDFVL